MHRIKTLNTMLTTLASVATANAIAPMSRSMAVVPRKWMSEAKLVNAGIPAHALGDNAAR